MRNRVFRCIERKARGFVGLLMGELIATFGMFGMFLVLDHPLVGIGIGGVVLLGLSAWRRRDADRGDYARTVWRRLRGNRGVWSP